MRERNVPRKRPHNTNKRNPIRSTQSSLPPPILHPLSIPNLISRIITLLPTQIFPPLPTDEPSQQDQKKPRAGGYGDENLEEGSFGCVVADSVVVDQFCVTGRRSSTMKIGGKRRYVADGKRRGVKKRRWRKTYVAETEGIHSSGHLSHHLSASNNPLHSRLKTYPATPFFTTCL
jgi:hypothetical protein